MGFTGRPSGACATCKRRKKKCDQTRPQCRQCQSIRKQCPGVPDEVDLVFRNKFSSDKQTSFDYPAIRRSSRSSRPFVSTTLPSRRSTHEYGICTYELAPCMPVNRFDMAMTYFVNLHCRDDLPTRRLNPWLGLQSKYFMTPKPGSALQHAVTALACMTMATEMKIPELAELSNQPYGEALRGINDAIATPSKAMNNEVAVGIFVLISYELKHQDVSRRRRYQAHTNGLKQLLVLRGRKQLANVESLYVFRALRVQIIYNSLLRGELLFDKDDEPLWTDQSPYNATPVDDLCAVAAHIPHLRAQVKRLNTEGLAATSSTLVTDASRVDHLLQRWLARWRDHLSHEVVSKVEDDDQLWQGQANIFTDLSHAALMNHYCFLRLLVLDAVLKGLGDPVVASTEAKLTHEHTLDQIQGSIDSICFSIPYMTGQVRGSNLRFTTEGNQKWIYTSHAEATWILLPIVIAAQQATITSIQKRWIVQQLIRLNADFCLWDASSMPLDSEKKLQIMPTNPKNIW